MRKRMASIVATLVAVAAGLALAVVLLGGGGAKGEPTATAGTPVAKKAARKPPVIVLLLDEFPPDSLLGPDGRIDAARFPNFARLAGTSTWFRNAHTIYDSTPKAIPAIMDARKPFKGQAADTRDHPRSIYTLLGGRGYRIVNSEEATALCPRRYCRNARGRRPGILENLNRRRPERLRGWVRSIAPGRPTFWLKHALFPHGPWMFLPSGKQTRPTVKDPVPGLASPAGFHDRGLTDHNHQRYMLQLGYLDRELGRMLDHMRGNGMLDKSLLVVTADHGYAWEVGVKDRRKVTQGNVDEVAPIPLFIKAPGQRAGRVNKAYARTIDIVPTMADILNVKLNWRVDGRSAFSRSVRRRREVRLPTRDFKRTIRIGARALESRRRGNIRRRVRLFSTGALSTATYGDPWGAVYAIGPNRHLLGRTLAELNVTGAGKTRASITGARLTRNVRFASATLPTQIGGRINRGRRGAKRDLAVAVNGRVEAVGRTFYIRGKGGESFDVMVPERALREGANDVRVFEVAGRGSALRLVPLGSN